MLRGLLSLLATLPLAATKGAGAWLDPKHYKGRASFAGMRFIAEDPPHVLNVVGTDPVERANAAKRPWPSAASHHDCISLSREEPYFDATCRIRIAEQCD